MNHRILIVDPDAGWRRQHAETLGAAAPQPDSTYSVVALGSPAAAQLQMTRQRFNLVLIADDETGEGLRLARSLNDLYHDDVRLLLVTADRPDAQRMQQLRSYGLPSIVRSISAAALITAVAEILGLHRPSRAAQPSAPAQEHNQRPPATLADVQMLLDMLKREARSQFAIYANNIGHVIVQNGDGSTVDVASLASLTAGSFVNSAELGRVLHDPDTIHLSVHEGRLYDMYAANVGYDRMLALLFDKALATPKLGFVFLLMKRCAQQLQRMRLSLDDHDTLLDQQLSASLNSEFDRIFGGELLAKE